MQEKRVEKSTVQTVDFIGEQDGVPERDLKAQLSVCFSRRKLECRAYLVQVNYPAERQTRVALCLIGISDDTELGFEIGAIFAKMFSNNDFLDTIYITPDQEILVGQVAKPFYRGPNKG